MTALACLLIAAGGRLAFTALAEVFRPVRLPLCQARPAYEARHRRAD